MNCLITGAGGYVGVHLTEVLQMQGVICFAPSHQEFDLMDLVGMERYCSGKRIDCVIHLAGAVGTNESGVLFDANIAGLYRLLQICSMQGICHFTFASGNVVYDSTVPMAHSTQEYCNPDPKNLYAVSKYAGELLVSNYCSTRGIDWANVRIADIYGPGQKTGNLICTVVDNVAQGKSLRLYGKGVRKRDYIYITDVAHGLAFISSHRMTGNLNLGTGIGTSVSQLVSLAAELSSELIGKPCDIQPVSVENEDISQIWLDTTSLQDAEFIPRISLRDGLKKCIEKKMKA